MNTIPVQITGNLTHDPELHFTGQGKAVGSLRLAVTPRRRNEAGKFEDGQTTFLSGTVWGPMAENAAESLHKGDRVLVFGRLVERSYTPTQGPRAGQEQRRHEVVIDEIGTSLRWATAAPSKAKRSGDAWAEAPADEEAPF